ncbi:hypothetical protein D3C87_1627350 [compost metagenome]
MLGHLVHGAHRSIDLIDRRGLLPALLGNRMHQVVGGTGGLEDRGQFFCRVGHQARAALDLGGALLDQRLDVGRSLRRRLRQPPHFHGHHRKALARLAGPRGLDRRI